MKRIIALSLFTALILTACSDATSSDELEIIQSSTSASGESSNYDPFAKSDDNKSASVGSYGYGVEWEDGKEMIIDYATTVSFRYYIDNTGETTDFGLLLFVNGFRQPYRTEEDSENKIIHIFDVENNEHKVQTIEFEPVVGKMGDEVSIEIISMFEPRFIKTENSNYEFHHRISSLYPSKMGVTQETELTEPDVCSDYIVTPITEEMRQAFDTFGATGASNGNALDNQIHIETLKNDIFYTPADLLKEEPDITPFTMNDSVTLCMYGGASCKYRVSMYINHELVTGAFDGMDYIDMTPSSDSICKKTIDLKNLNFSLADYNHLYFIAVPFYTNQNYEETMVVKSASVTLDCTK